MFSVFQRIILGVGMLFGAVLSADEPQRELLQSTIDAALDVLYAEGSSQLSFEEKQAKVRAAIEAHYDLDVIIRRAIGRNWRLMSVPEQAKVLELIKRLVLKAYVQGLDGKSRPVVTLGEVVAVADKRIEIQSTIILDEQTYSVLYRLGRMKSGWQIYDIVAENISVVSNYRQQIDDHFRRSTGAELITRLEELLEQDAIDEDLQI